jgi:hypothetical protein
MKRTPHDTFMEWAAVLGVLLVCPGAFLVGPKIAAIAVFALVPAVTVILRIMRWIGLDDDA